MADEAILRIVLDDAGGTAASQPPAPPAPTPSAPPTTTAPYDPNSPAERARQQQVIDERAARLAARRAALAATERHDDPSKSLTDLAAANSPENPTKWMADYAAANAVSDPAAARAMRLAEKRAAAYRPADTESNMGVSRRAMGAEFVRYGGTTPPPAPPTPPVPPPPPPPPQAQAPPAPPPPVAEQSLDPKVARIEELRRRINLLESMTPRPNSPAAQKLEQLKKLLEKETQQPDARPTFDPAELARKRLEREERMAAVDAEYRKLKPQVQKSGLDDMLEAVESMRGTVGAIGGTFGRIFGAVLDITARVRQIRARAALEPPLPIPLPAAPPPPPPLAAPAAQLTPPAPVAPTAPVTPTTPVAPTTPPAIPPPAGQAPAAAPAAKAAPNAPAAPAATPPPVPTTAASTAGASGAASGAAAAGGVMAGAASAVPYIGAIVVGISAAVGVIKGLIDTLNKTADKYAEFNPAIAQAQAMAEIRGIMNDMRRAQESGPELVRFVKAQAEMEQKWEELKIKLLMEITPGITQIISLVSALLDIAAQTNEDRLAPDDPTSVILNDELVKEAQRGAALPMDARDIIDATPGENRRGF